MSACLQIDCGCGTKGCRGKCDWSWKRRLHKLMQCEPFCGSGFCGTPLAPPLRTDPCRALIAMLVDQGVAGITRTGDGDHECMGVVFGDKVLPLEQLCAPVMCSDFGPHFNNEKKISEFSPQDVKAVAMAFELTDEDVTIPIANLSVTGTVATGGPWYMVPLGFLGVSHEFCVEAVTITMLDALGNPTPLVPSNLAAGGVIIACGDGGEGADEGSYVKVLDNPSKAKPGDIVVTEYRCACDNLCAWTPARGGEAVYFRHTGGFGANVSIRMQVTIRRCDWLVTPPDMDCISPIGNRLALGAAPADIGQLGVTAAAATALQAQRATGGAVPFM